MSVVSVINALIITISNDLEVMAANATDGLKCMCKCIKEKIEKMPRQDFCEVC